MDDNRATYAGAPPQRESLAELIGQLARDTATLVHDEIELLVQRGREAANAIGSGIVMTAVGAVLLLGAFLSLCAAFIIWLSGHIAPELAAAGTGVALALVGLGVLFAGIGRLKKSLHK